MIILKARAVVVCFLVTFLLLGALWCWLWLPRVVFVPIEVVSLSTKLQYVDPAAIKLVVSRHLQEGFFGLKMQQLRNELQDVPWVAKASLERCWPNVLKINVQERQPMAILNGTGVIDTEGRLFFPTNMTNIEGVPSFSGKESAVADMVETYLSILKALKPIGLAIKNLELMVDGGWRAVLSSGTTVIFGQDELQERLLRLVWAYDTIAADRNSANFTIDLRYTNGLAIAHGGTVEKAK